MVFYQLKPGQRYSIDKPQCESLRTLQNILLNNRRVRLGSHHHFIESEQCS